MAGLKQIKTKIVAMKKSQTVTKAMEAVSAAKMRKAQHTALRGRTYARAAAAVLTRVASSSIAVHPLLAERTISRALYIVITSDKGLAGALNSGVLKSVARAIEAQGLSTTDVSIIAVGRKANDFFSSRGYSVEAYHPHTNSIDNALIEQVVQEAAGRYQLGAVDAVYVAYQNFISTFEQRPTVRKVFPIALDEVRAMVEDITPKRGAFAEVEPNAPVYKVEPSEEEVLNAILPRLAGIFVYHALLESEASEHSARMVAMKSASDKAGEKQEELTLQFNKARQAAITREVSEITGGMEAMAV